MTEQFQGATPAGPAARGDAEDRAPVKRDGRDRYLLPELDGRAPVITQGLTRVSTTKSALSNTIGIQRWTNRLTAEGMATSPELITEAAKLVATQTPDERKSAMGKLAERAQVKAGSKDRSNLGTAVHLHHEKLARGQNPGSVPEEHVRDVSAYEALLSEYQVQLLPEYLERTVKCLYGHAGTADNIVRWWNPDMEEWELVVADLKTGRDLELGWLEILIQLWFYAHAVAMWVPVPGEPNDGHYEPMPADLRTDRALIFHTPMNGTATLFVIDLSGVDAYVEAAITARRANAEAKHKVRSIGTVDLRGPAYVGQAPVPASLVTESAKAVQQIINPPATPTVTRTEYDDQFQSARTGKYEAEGWVTGGPVITPQDQPELPPAQAERVARYEMSPAVRVRPEPERDPVTGRKKRTCGFCHLPGHTQKNCPQNPASEKFQGASSAATDSDPAEQVDIGNDYTIPGQGSGHTKAQFEAWQASQSGKDVVVRDSDTYFPGQVPEATKVRFGTPADAARTVTQAEAGDATPAEGTFPGQVTGAELAQHQPPPVYRPMGPEPEPGTYCDGSHTAGWASNGEIWVCGACGLPSKLEASRLAVMAQSDAPRDSVMISITEAASSVKVLEIRNWFSSTGEWSPDHDRYAQARYNALRTLGH